MGNNAPDYEFFKEYGGTLDEGSFNAALPHALAEVKRITWPNIVTDTDEEEAYKRAVCAAIIVDAAYSFSGGVGEGISSMTVGSFSVSTTTNASGTTAYDADMAKAIQGELVGTGLLFMGI